jgi:hypothetical protein
VIVMETLIKLSAAKEAAEKVESATSAAKAADGDKGLIAALKRCATQKLICSAACKAAFKKGVFSDRLKAVPFKA